MRQAELKNARALGEQKVCCGTPTSSFQALSSRSDIWDRKVWMKLDHGVHRSAAVAAARPQWSNLCSCTMAGVR